MRIYYISTLTQIDTTLSLFGFPTLNWPSSTLGKWRRGGCCYPLEDTTLYWPGIHKQNVSEINCGTIGHEARQKIIIIIVIHPVPSTVGGRTWNYNDLGSLIYQSTWTGIYPRVFLLNQTNTHSLSPEQCLALHPMAAQEAASISASARSCTTSLRSRGPLQMRIALTWVAVNADTTAVHHW